MSLYREEVFEKKRRGLLGEITVFTPLRLRAFVVLSIFAFVILSTLVLPLRFGKTERVQGYLTPAGGLTRIYSDRPGVVEGLSIRVGDSVSLGQSLIELSNEARDKSGTSIGAKSLRSYLTELDEIEKTILLSREANVSKIRDTNTQRELKELELKSVGKELRILDEQIELVIKKKERLTTLVLNGSIQNSLADEVARELLEAEYIRSTVVRIKHGIDSDIQNLNMQLAYGLEYSHQQVVSNLESRKQFLERKINELSFQEGFSIFSPLSGVVSSINTDVGQIINSNQTLLTIRPLGSLVAKVLVPSKAAGLLELEQHVKIRYDAFPYEHYGSHQARIIEISNSILKPHEFEGPIGLISPSYVVRLLIDDQSVVRANQEFLLKPDMLLTADIILEERTVFNWILKPIFKFQDYLE